MNYPISLFDYSLRSEAIRILFTAKQIRNGFYIKKGFYVVPYSLKGIPVNIFFPQLDYESIPHFWERVEKVNLEEIPYAVDLLQDIERILPKTALDFSSLEKEWQEKLPAFWSCCVDLLPNIFSSIKKVEVRPTYYGSTASGAEKKWAEKDEIIIYIRKDEDCSYIAKAILLTLLPENNYIEKYQWEGTQSIIDFLLDETKLKDIFPKFTGTIEALQHKQYAQLAQDSTGYLKQLGFTRTSIFSLENEHIHINGKLMLLSEQEKSLMKVLILQKRTILSFDTLGEALWGKDVDEKFSPYAISKVIERLRKKIEAHGVFSEIIQAKRGQGYILLDE